MKLTIRQRSLGKIPLLEVVPRSQRNQLLPLIVYYHGWQSAKELVLTQGRKLAEKGFRVLLPDAANHGDRRQDITRIPSLTFWQSIHANLFEFGFIVNHFKKLGLADERIAVGGVSMGGFTTCALLTHHPEIKVAACVMGSPMPYQYGERIIKRAKEAGRFYPHDYKALLSWVPEYDLSLHVEKLNGRPLLFWHGTEDKIVPFNDIVDFVKVNPLPNITFIREEEKHLVRGETMDKVSDYFYREMNRLS